MRLLNRFFIAVWLLILLVACNPKQKNPCAVDFDQLALLTNIADNIIIPSYNSLKTEVDDLVASIAAFTTDPTTTTLVAAQNQLLATNLAWQKAKIFEFGPAAAYQLRATLNNYPVFVNRLEEGATSGTYNLEIDSFEFAKGFPALDYLLHATTSDTAAIIASYSTAVTAANRRQFLTDVVTQIQQKVNWVHTDWASYANTFKTTEGTATGTPLSLFVNQLNQDYELFKNKKLEDPIGAQVSYIPDPQLVEAYYSRQSLALALASVKASKEAFQGGTGIGLDDYVQTISVDKDGVPLEQLILNQYNAVINALENLQTTSLHDAIQNNFSAVKTVYAKAQNQVVYLKTDMPAVLCVNINYVDETDDGD